MILNSSSVSLWERGKPALVKLVQVDRGLFTLCFGVFACLNMVQAKQKEFLELIVDACLI